MSVASKHKFICKQPSTTCTGYKSHLQAEHPFVLEQATKTQRGSRG